MNTNVAGDPMYCRDKVLGSDLTIQEDQGEFNPYPIILQLGTGSRAGSSNADYQSMYCSDKVLNSYRVGLDLTAQRNIGKSNTHLSTLQPNDGLRIEPRNIDFSKSMTQLLGSLGDLNQNIKEGFSVVAACSNNWRLALASRLTNHEDRLSKLEYELSAMNSSILTTQSLNSEIRMGYRRFNFLLEQHENIIPTLNLEVQLTSQRVNAVESSIKKKIQELEERMKEIRESNLNSEIPPKVINSLSSIIMVGAPSTIIEYITQQV